jgi:hypothetical protein
MRFRRQLCVAITSAAAVMLSLGVSPAAAKTNCCFEMSIEALQSAEVDYGESLPQPYHGVYQVERDWSVRSIVAFEQGSSGPASFSDIITEVRLVTVERSTLSERHARLDGHGNYTYPYEDIPCPARTVALEPGDEHPHVEDGVVALTKGSAGYRLRLSMGTLFDGQPRLCPGGSDLSLHANEGADRPVAEIPAPKMKYFRLATEGDRKSRTIVAPPVSITHGGVAGLHTFNNYREATVNFSWFPKARMKPEKERLRGIKCGPQFCDKDSWGT